MNTEQRISALEQGLSMAGLSTKKVLSFEEAHVFTGISKSYLYKLTSTQRIPHFKPSGKLLYFDREELERWLTQHRVSTTDEIESKAQTFCMKQGGRKA